MTQKTGREVSEGTCDWEEKRADSVIVLVQILGDHRFVSRQGLL